MQVLSKDESLKKGPSVRTRRLVLQTAIELMQSGHTPSVSELAEAAEVSRATAYRYFPTQQVMIHDVVVTALGTILDWESEEQKVEKRVEELLSFCLPRIEAFEATFRATLSLDLSEGQKEKSGHVEEVQDSFRGHRIVLLNRCLAPLEGKLKPKEIKHLVNCLSLVFGIEYVIVAKDVCKMNSSQMLKHALTVASEMVDTALAKASVSCT